MSGRLRVVPGTLVGALVTLSVHACCPYPPPQPAPAHAAGCPTGTAPADSTELHACLSTLEFDTVTAAGDEQRLMVREAVPGPLCHGGDSTESCRYGPLAKIEPVKGAQARDSTELNGGRIIARLFLRPGETESYPKLGLTPGDTTYWWVKRETATQAASRYVRISADSVVATQEQTIEIEGHTPETYRQALARFIWDDADEKTQGPCGSGCCK
jgi:hypothetical protein